MNPIEPMPSFAGHRLGAGVFVPLDCLSRRARVFITHTPHKRSPIAKIAALVEAAAKRDDDAARYLAVDDFLAQCVVRAPGADLLGSETLTACRAYLAARGLGWPGDDLVSARLAAGILAAFGVQQSHDLRRGLEGARRGWRGVALWA